MTSWPDTWPQNSNTFLTIFKWMLQEYCACHEKVEPRHTKSCNCHAKWSLQSNTSVTWNLLPFQGFSVGCFKHRHHKARNHCACHANRIVSDPLQIPHACQRFCNPHELLRLPRICNASKSMRLRNTLWTSKNVPRPSVFNDFDLQISLARRRGPAAAWLKPAPTTFWAWGSLWDRDRGHPSVLKSHKTREGASRSMAKASSNDILGLGKLLGSGPGAIRQFWNPIKPAKAPAAWLKPAATTCWAWASLWDRDRGPSVSFEISWNQRGAQPQHG